MDKLGALLNIPLTPLRPYLQPITSNLPLFLREPIENLLTPACYQHLIVHLDPLADPKCLTLAASKAIGIAIITASTIVKIPQLLKLLNSKSSAGVSFLSYLLETVAFVITLAYNFRSGFPFSTFGETACILLQNVAIAVLVLVYSGNNNSASGKGGASSSLASTAGPVTFILGLVGLTYYLFIPSLLPMETLRLIQAFITIPLSLASKIPQILAVHKSKSTGQLSAFAVFNYVLGSLARVFTTLAEVDDPLILGGFLAGAVLNVVLAAQMVMYWNAGAAGKADVDAGKKRLEKKEEERKAEGLKTAEKKVKASGVDVGRSASPRSGGRRKA
ncbi:mannose-P-dolichol utilization defect 1 protein-like protein [Peziza echinospora]|nr:mannose-P-dolichol utilization defect 1 protein-like protein [Peziza echinospora]